MLVINRQRFVLITYLIEISTKPWARRLKEADQTGRNSHCCLNQHRNHQPKRSSLWWTTHWLRHSRPSSTGGQFVINCSVDSLTSLALMLPLNVMLTVYLNWSAVYCAWPQLKKLDKDNLFSQLAPKVGREAGTCVVSQWVGFTHTVVQTRIATT